MCVFFGGCDTSSWSSSVLPPFPSTLVDTVTEGPFALIRVASDIRSLDICCVEYRQFTFGQQLIPHSLTHFTASPFHFRPPPSVRTPVRQVVDVFWAEIWDKLEQM